MRRSHSSVTLLDSGVRIPLRASRESSTCTSDVTFEPDVHDATGDASLNTYGREHPEIDDLAWANRIAL